MAETQAISEVQKDTTEAATRLAKSIGDAQAKIQKKADAKAKTGEKQPSAAKLDEQPDVVDKEREKAVNEMAAGMIGIVQKVVDDATKKNFLNRSADKKPSAEATGPTDANRGMFYSEKGKAAAAAIKPVGDKPEEVVSHLRNLVKENEKATSKDTTAQPETDAPRHGSWNGWNGNYARSYPSPKRLVEPLEKPTHLASRYAHGIYKANEVLGKLLCRVHWQDPMKALDEKDAERLSAVLDASIVGSTISSEGVLWAVGPAFLLKAYANHIVNKLTKNELTVLVDTYEGLLRPLNGVTGHYDRKQGLARYTGLPEEDYGYDPAPLTPQREMEMKVDAELRTEIQALCYAESNHLLSADIFKYLTNVHGSTPYSLYMSVNVRTEGQIFKIPSGPLGETVDVSMGALNVLRGYIGHKKRALTILEDLRYNAPSSLRNALDLATLQLYPVIKPDYLNLTHPEGFGAYFAYPFMQHYHRATHVADLLGLFLVDLTKELKPQPRTAGGELEPL